MYVWRWLWAWRRLKIKKKTKWKMILGPIDGWIADDMWGVMFHGFS